MLLDKIVLSVLFLVASVMPSFALAWICPAPEIDATVAPSALAILVAAGFIAYNRVKA